VTPGRRGLHGNLGIAAARSERRVVPTERTRLLLPPDSRVRLVNPDLPPGLDGVAWLSVSESGSVVYLVGSGLGDASLGRVALVDPDGNVEPLLLAPGNLGSPAFCPDGRRIAYNRSSQVSVYDLLLGTSVAITTGDASLMPVWSLGGARIAFIRFGSRAGEGLDTYWKSADRSGSEQVLAVGDVAVSPTDWIVGHVLLNTQPGPGQNDIAVLQLEGDGIPTPYLEAEYDESAAVVSPNERWIAYESNPSNERRVYVRSFPDPGPPTQVSLGRGRYPRWTPGSERIYYTARDTLFAADVRADSTFEVLGVEALVPFPYIRGYDVAPDNSGFVVIVREAAEETENADEAVPPRTYFVVNWFDEIRARLARGN